MRSRSILLSLEAFSMPCRIVACVVSLVVADRLPAQSVAVHGLDPTKPMSQYNIDTWGEDDGLPQNFVSALAQTPDGYLWLGSEEGLIRFDGVHFAIYTPSNTPALSTGWVKALWADSDGTLWIGTGGGGLVRYRDGVFTAFTHEDGLSDDRVGAVLRDRSGRLWIGTEGGGLARFVDGRFETVGKEAGLSGDYVFSIAEDSAGTIWVGTDAGLNRLDASGIRVYTRRDGLASDRVTALAAGRGGVLWVGGVGGVTRLRGGEFVRYGSKDGLTSELVNWLYEDARGALWIGTHGGGLNRLYDGAISALTSATGFPGDMVWTIYEDREGHLWLGVVAAGLVRLQDGAFDTYGKSEGLSADIALAVLEDRSGALWVGTAGGGVNRIAGGDVVAYGTRDGLAHDVVIALAESSNGDIWVGTAVGGLSRIRGGRVRTFRAEDGVIGGPIGVILEDRAGNLWLGGSGAGLQRWRPGPPRTYTREDGLPDNVVTALLEDSAGRLWIGTRGGLVRFDEGRFVPFRIEGGAPVNSIRDLYEDSDGTLWIATHDGLVRWVDGRFFVYGEAEGLIGREVHAIAEDDRGYLWVSSNRGIFRVAKEELNAVAEGRAGAVRAEVFGRADGLRSAEANGGIQPGVWRRRDGTLWFPTMKGVAAVDPGQVDRPRYPPVPVFEHLVAGDQVFPGGASLDLPPDRRSLAFHFTAPSFRAPHRIRFRYRLEGHDEDWVDAQGRRTAYYTNVPPGRYRFRVQAADAEGQWNETEATVALSIAPYFHETRIFIACVVVLLACTVIAIHRLRVRRLTSQQAELLRVVAERERTERALRRSEERLRIALEAGQMGAWEWHLPSGTLYWSDSMSALFGYTPGTFEEGRSRLLELLDDRDVQRVAAALDAYVKEPVETFALDFRLSRPDGAVHHIEVRGRLFVDREGKPVRVAGIAADVTARIQAQEALRQREEQLRQAQKMEAVGRLAGGVAHDFNNLLSVIAGNVELVLDELPEESPLRKDLEEIAHASRRGSNLTQQLLAFSRKQVLQPRTQDLNDVVAGIERLLRRLIREDVALETRLCPDPVLVSVDVGGIEQVLINLVVNAQDAMPQGGRIVVATALDEGTVQCEHGGAGGSIAGPHVVLSVSDTGHGMDEETRRRIFEPFFTTKEIGKGTGLGLATVYGVVQQSGGCVDVCSEPGRGTTFTIRLPLVEGEAEADAPREVEDECARGTETILVVEDEASVRALARKILARRGYVVLDAATGSEALELCRRSEVPIHLLVADVVLPGMGGQELAEQVLRLRPETRILFMSGYTEDEVIRRGALDSGIAFIAKPFSPAELARRVREVLDGHVTV